MGYEKKIPENTECGISVGLKVLGGKWNAWVIECIADGIHRPSEIQREMKEASPRVINMQLRELIRCGIIYKKIYQEVPLKVEYYLTETGISVLPVIEAIGIWGNEKRDHVFKHSKQLSKIN